MTRKVTHKKWTVKDNSGKNGDVFDYIYESADGPVYVGCVYAPYYPNGTIGYWRWNYGEIPTKESVKSVDYRTRQEAFEALLEAIDFENTVKKPDFSRAAYGLPE